MTEKITSAQNPRLKRVVKLRTRRSRDRDGVFLIEGYRELQRAVDSGLVLEELFICPELYLGENEPQLVERAARKCGARVTTLPAPLFAKLAYRDRPEGLLAVAPQPDWSLERLKPGTHPLLVVACAIEKPGNLGTILRSADCVGAHGVIVCDRATDIFNPNVVRASIGTLFTVPVAEASSDRVLPWLRRHGVRTVATSPSADREYTECDLTEPTAIVLGSEQYGLDERWLAETDLSLRIPMAGQADSLNVAMAATVVLFEAHRQRRGNSAEQKRGSGK